MSPRPAHLPDHPAPDWAGVWCPASRSSGSHGGHLHAECPGDCCRPHLRSFLLCRRGPLLHLPPHWMLIPSGLSPTGLTGFPDHLSESTSWQASWTDPSSGSLQQPPYYCLIITMITLITQCNSCHLRGCHYLKLIATLGRFFEHTHAPLPDKETEAWK